MSLQNTWIFKYWELSLCWKWLSLNHHNFFLSVENTWIGVVIGISFMLKTLEFESQELLLTLEFQSYKFLLCVGNNWVWTTRVIFSCDENSWFRITRTWISIENMNLEITQMIAQRCNLNGFDLVFSIFLFKLIGASCVEH